jgi:hypothetical protein
VELEAGTDEYQFSLAVVPARRLPQESPSGS